MGYGVPSCKIISKENLNPAKIYTTALNRISQKSSTAPARKTYWQKNQKANKVFMDTTVNVSRVSPKLSRTFTTYSRKPGDYNGTIIFEIAIMKNSSPLNLKFKFLATVKTKITHLFCWTHSTLSSPSKCDGVNQNIRNNQKVCDKVKFDKDLNWLETISISKIMVPF